MSFYGKVVNHLNNVFEKIGVRRKDETDQWVDELQSTTNNSLIFKGDNALTPSVEKNENNIIVSYSHMIQENPEEGYYANGYSNDPENLNKYYLGIQVPQFDQYGHATANKTSVAILSIKDDGQGNITIENPQDEGANIIWIGQDYYTQY